MFHFHHDDANSVASVSGEAILLMLKPFAEKEFGKTNVNQDESKITLNVMKLRCCHKYFPIEASCLRVNDINDSRLVSRCS